MDTINDSPVLNIEKFQNLVANGKIFSVTFTRRMNGEERKMVCRTGVKKYLKGGEAPYNPSEKGLLCVFDMESRGYRSIPVDEIKHLKANGQIFA